jgi:hypothetical protein
MALSATAYLGKYRSFSGIKQLFADIYSVIPGIAPRGEIYFVDANNGSDSNDGLGWDSAWLTLAHACATVASGDTIVARGEFTENVTTTAGSADVTITGVSNQHRHADDHPLNGELMPFTWKAATNAPLLQLRNPGWRLENILFAAHASNYAIEMDRTADEDETEQDASHLSVIGCRFASGAGGINDTGGCFNVLVKDNTFQALTSFCILGVGNIGNGQKQWRILDNHFTGFTNGVKIAANECVIKGNFFTDGGTPGTTVVLNTVNALAADNFVVDNYFQTATANFATPDIEGNATDVWNNTSIDGTANMIGREVGQPA